MRRARAVGFNHSFWSQITWMWQGDGDSTIVFGRNLPLSGANLNGPSPPPAWPLLDSPVTLGRSGAEGKSGRREPVWGGPGTGPALHKRESAYIREGIYSLIKLNLVKRSCGWSLGERARSAASSCRWT